MKKNLAMRCMEHFDHATCQRGTKKMIDAGIQSSRIISGTAALLTDWKNGLRYYILPYIFPDGSRLIFRMLLNEECESLRDDFGMGVHSASLSHVAALMKNKKVGFAMAAENKVEFAMVAENSEFERFGSSAWEPLYLLLFNIRYFFSWKLRNWFRGARWHAKKLATVCWLTVAAGGVSVLCWIVKNWRGKWIKQEK